MFWGQFSARMNNLKVYDLACLLGLGRCAGGALLSGAERRQVECNKDSLLLVVQVGKHRLTVR